MLNKKLVALERATNQYQKRYAKLEREYTRVNRALRVLSESSRILLRATDENAYLQKVCEILIRSKNYSLAWIGMIVNDREKSVRPVAEAGFKRGYLRQIKISWGNTKWGKGPTGLCIRKKTTQIVQNAMTDPRYKNWLKIGKKFNFLSTISIPIIINGMCIGALMIYTPEREAFDRDEIKLLEELVEDISYGIKNLRLYIILGETQTQLKSIYHTAQDAILLINDQYKIILCNPSTFSLFGYEENELLNQNISKVIAVPKKQNLNKSNLYHLIEGSVRKNYLKPIDLIGIKKNGEQIFLSASLSLTRLENKKNFVCVLHDISDRVRLIDEMKHRLEFEDLVLKISTRFAISYPDQIGHAITCSLKDITQFISADVCHLYLTENQKCNYLYFYSSKSNTKYLNITALKQDFFKWLSKEKAYHIIQFFDIKNISTKIPVNKNKYLKLGFKSILIIPLINEKNQLNGYLDFFFRRPSQWFSCEDVTELNTLGNIIMHAIARKNVAEQLDDTFYKLKIALTQIIELLSNIVEKRDPYTAGHQRRAAKLATAIAKEMNLSNEQIKAIEFGGIVHDIGKLYVSAELLSKPGKLSPEEFAIIKMHPQVGYELIKDIQLPWPIANIILQHHERYNGSGYPRGLKKDEIMLEARILTVADVVEAMSTHRPYRSARTLKEALREIKKNKGILYDPEVVDACLRVFRHGYRLEKSF